MPLYAYLHRVTGERLEMVRRGNNPPPRTMVVLDRIKDQVRAASDAEIIDPQSDVWERDDGKLTGMVKDPHRGATCFPGATLPISHRLPLAQEHEIAGRTNIQGHDVLELKNGTHATLDGQRIIDGHESAARHAAATGFVRDGS